MSSATILAPEPGSPMRGAERAREPASCPSPFANPHALVRFHGADGEREVRALSCPDGATLLLDCRPGALSDARVIGRIACEEPPQNASLLAAMYAADERRGRPRALCAADLAPNLQSARSPNAQQSPPAAPLIDTDGNDYSIGLTSGPAVPELRWLRTAPGPPSAPEPVSLRAAVGALENYEPALALTELALATRHAQASSGTLRAELARLRRSSIVLNRALREAVARRVAEGTSLSEIALRCDRVKHDRRGNRSGETSWLARRIGQLPESGQPRPTPWIHSKTLALIAREGLCISPHEVEL